MATPMRSADLLVDKILSDPAKMADVKANPEKALREVAAQVTQALPPPPTYTDPTIYHIVTLSLGLVAIGAVIGAIWLTLSAQQVPDIMTALGAGAIGALAGLLTPPGAKSG